MAYSEFYARTTGSDLNSGSSNDNAATLTYASGTWAQATRVFTVASGNPVTDGIAVGDFVSVYADGSSVTGYVARVTARDATTITTSSSVKVGTAPTDGTNNRTLKRGGAWATLAQAMTLHTGLLVNVAGEFPRLNIVGASWSISAALTHTPTAIALIEGCTSTAGDGGIAVIDGGAAGASYVLLTCAGAVYVGISNIRFQNNGNTGAAALVNVSAGRKVFTRCQFTGGMGAGLLMSAGAIAVGCEAWANNASNTASTGAFTLSVSSECVDCVAHDNAGSNTSGFYLGAVSTCSNCIADNNGGSGFTIASASCLIIGCTSYRNAAAGVNFASTSGSAVINSDLVKNGTYGIVLAASIGGRSINNRYAGPNVSGTVSLGSGAWLDETGAVTEAGSNYVDVDDAGTPRGGNFTPAVGSGARSAGVGTFLMNSTTYDSTPTSYPDIGAVRHADPAGGGGSIFGGAIVR